MIDGESVHADPCPPQNKNQQMVLTLWLIGVSEDINTEPGEPVASD